MAKTDISSPIPGAVIINDDGSVTENPDVVSDLDPQLNDQVTDLGEAEPETDFDAETFESLRSLVAVKASQSDELKGQISELQESLKNLLTNDATLAEAEEKAKESRKQVTERKKSLNESPEAKSIKAKLLELKEDLADIEDSLSSQLLNLYQITGVKEFETPSGEVREFVIKARVKSKRNKKLEGD